MKFATRLMAVLLLAVMVLSLVSCGSTFGTIKKNFTDAGYEYVESSDDSQAKTITAELEKGNLSCTVHFFKTKDALVGALDVYCMVLEFSSDKDLEKALSEDGSATLRGMIKDAQESEYVRGNCILVPLSLTKADDMKKTFNK